MLSHSLRRATRSFKSPVSSRLLHAFSVSSTQAVPGKDPRLSQGNVGQEAHRHPSDPHDQAARGGQKVRQGAQSSGPYDAASRTGGQKTDRSGLSGNQEGVGFAEQVGSASSSGKRGASASAGEGKGGEEEAEPKGLAERLMSALGQETGATEAKHKTGRRPYKNERNDSGKRAFHFSAARGADPTVGQAPEASRQPKERTNAEQNEHLVHKPAGTATASKDTGKGNAGEDPKLPSHQFDNKPSNSQHKRAFSTSARRLEEPKHTAESYFKDVDDSPPASTKTHQVDGSGTGSQVQRPNEPMTGEFSRAGPDTKEYQTVSHDGQYDLPPDEGPEKDQKMRYGNVPQMDSSESTQGGVSKPGEGPEGAAKGGRKPEGRS
ncbi:hypothetical protein C8Q78DRAFT_959793 [Trametes maxima]|nr:hypothetical protein C8Q78DRAFT_959793 [Trametes maxima]